MEIKVGTLVTRRELDFDGKMVNPCNLYNVHYPDVPDNLQTCVGIVYDDLSRDVVVTWVHICRFHHSLIENYQDRTDRNLLHAVGQL